MSHIIQIQDYPLVRDAAVIIVLVIWYDVFLAQAAKLTC